MVTRSFVLFPIGSVSSTKPTSSSTLFGINVLANSLAVSSLLGKGSLVVEAISPYTDASE